MRSLSGSAPGKKAGGNAKQSTQNRKHGSAPSTKSAEIQESAATSRRRQAGGTGMNDLFIGIFGIAFLLSVSLNFLHSSEKIQHSHETPIEDVLRDFKRDLAFARSQKQRGQQLPTNHDNTKQQQQQEWNQAETTGNNIQSHDLEKHHPAAHVEDNLDEHASERHEGRPIMSTLKCDSFGGPSQELAQELVYWQEIPSDASYISPFHLQSATEERYMTFEPDGGGWNNIRMAMESTIALAVAMGRTLVMPPQKKMYLLGQGRSGQQKHFSFADFFPIQELADEHVGLNIISMEEYLQRIALTGQLRHKNTTKIEFPPGNRTNWDGIDQSDYDIMRGYLRNVTTTAKWNPSQCLPSFPASGDHKDVEMLQSLVHDIAAKNDNLRKAIDKFIDNPVPVNASARLRLEENLAGREKLCVYDQFLQKEHTIHFQCNHKQRLRMLVHFYAFIFFEDWREDVWMKRFVRDHIRYKDEIQCAAARVVQAVRERTRRRDPEGNPNGLFDTFHVRRGDFQYKKTRISAQDLYKNTKDELLPNTTIFIATDERDKSYFDPLRAFYDIVFLDDYMDLLPNMNTNYFGMIDQLVAARGRVFFGCYFSTFTGYINRLRGYHSVHEELPGYERGELPTTYYYTPTHKKLDMHKYMPLKPGFFNRENPVSWRDINRGIGMLHSSAV